MSVETCKSLFDVLAVVLLGFTFFAGAGVLITGNIINQRQQEKLGILSGDLAKQQERAAKAERDLLELRERVKRQHAPRWVFLEPLSKFLFNRPAGSVEIVFAPEDDEAQKTAMGIALHVGPTPNWKIIGLPHPYSEEDVIPRFQTPDMKKNVFHVPLFERVGGISDITVLFSPVDAGTDVVPFPRAGTAVEALWRGLIACGFEPVSEEDPQLTAGTARIVVGPKN
jgi:hypothetical protein